MAATVRGYDRNRIYDVLCHFEEYPQHCEAVRRVSVTRETDGTAESEWEVDFRNGVLCWTEADCFELDEYQIRFNEVAGDVDHFAGYWKVEEDQSMCTVRFVVDFDLGIPSLSHIIDPIAELALYENFQKIVKGLLGAETVESFDVQGVQAG
jgi:ribosome-associated toxin RatA of RatAB toxin-antitoxin module